MVQVEQITRPKLELVIRQPVDSPYWSITRFYQDKNLDELKLFILEAARAFWLPLAHVHQGETSQAILRDAVLKSLSLLRWRVTELTITYELDKSKQEAISSLVKQGRKPAFLEIEQRLFIKANSPVEILWKYLLQDEIGLNLEKKILWSSSAYWGVLAYREVLGLSQEDLRVIAANCVTLLQNQIQLLYQYFPNILEQNLNGARQESFLNAQEKTLSELRSELDETQQIDIEIEQEKLLNCSELDEVGLNLFGPDQF